MTPTPVDPWSAGIMGATSVATAALDDKTSLTQSTKFSSTVDSSGWVVNIGAGSASNKQDKSTSDISGITNLLKNPLVLLLIVAAIYYRSKK